MSVVQRVLSPLVDLRREETLTALLLFAYSFLAMTVWNTIKPLTRSQFIRDLGADNLPYVLLAAGLVIGVLMAGYAWLLSRLHRRWGLPIVQAGMAGVLVAFWALFRTDATWVSVVFYVLGLILGLLLISQFWTVANLVYNPRQAKRLFGFIGGGAPLGGMAGSALAAVGATRIGSVNLLLPSAALMLLAALVTAWIIRREDIDAGEPAGSSSDPGASVGAGEAFRLLQQSPHLRLIALVISFAAISAALIEQQLNMAAEAQLGAEATDAITSLLGWIGVGTSAIGLIIQLWVTSRVHRYLGIGFALMVLPVSLGLSAVIMLFNAVLWAPALARVLDQSLRYTLDKTSREVLFLPLPDAIKLRAKPFVDVTVDRAARAGAALLLILLVQPWALNLDWQGISYASLTMVGLWIVTSARARQGYVRAFRRSIERQDVAPADLRLSSADLTTVETLVQELAHHDPHRVVYAIEVLESLGKRNLVTPLLLHHAAPEVRERALQALAAAHNGMLVEWLPQIRGLLADPAARVRAAAVQAIGLISNQAAVTLARSMAVERNERIRATAATVLARSGSPADVALAETTLLELSGDASERGRTARLEAALAIGEIDQARFSQLLVPLLYDPAPEVAEAALHSVHAMRQRDVLFVPTVVTLLRNRLLRDQARDVLVAFGPEVVAPLAYFLQDQDEDLSVRRRIPDTVSRIPSQASVDLLVATLTDPDGVIRFEAIAGLERLRRTSVPMHVPRGPIEAQAVSEAHRYFTYLVLDDLGVRGGGLAATSLLARALEQKIERARRRVFGLLKLIYPWKDVSDAQWALDHGDADERSSASEFLDNMLAGELRKRLMPVLEDLTVEEKVQRARELVRVGADNADQALLTLCDDPDAVIAAAAIDAVRRTRRWHLLEQGPRWLSSPGSRDRCVSQSAAFAKAAWHGSTHGQEPPMPAPWPVVAVVDRLLDLPLFAPVSVNELFRLACAARQVQHAPGTVLAARGSRPEFVHLLLDGTVVAEGGGLYREFGAPAAIGVLEALKGLPMPEHLRVAGGATTLSLTVEEFRTALAESPNLVSGLFAMSVDQATTRMQAVQWTDAAQTCEALAVDGLTAAEKLVLLERVPLFEALSPAEALHVAEISRDVPLRAGARVFSPESDPAIWIVLSGDLVLDGGDAGAPLAAGPGSVIGALATLSGRPTGRAASVLRDGVALRIDRDDLFALLGEHSALLAQLLTGAFTLVSPQSARPVPPASTDREEKASGAVREGVTVG